MFRFLRRVFILLVLFVIVFLVFRFVKPEATSRFVDKVKNIPTTISGRFHREKKSDIIINGSTTSTKSNFEINDDEYDDYDNEYIPAVIDENDNDWDAEDRSRLEQLNRELDRIIASGNNQSQWSETNTDNNWSAEEIVSELINNDTTPTWNTLPSWFVVIDVEQPYEPESKEQTTTQNTNQTTTNNNSNSNSQTTNNSQNNKQNNNQNNKQYNTTSTQQQWDCWEWLSVQDCEEIYNIFWNINID